MAWLVFVVALRRVLRAAEGEPASLTTLAFGARVVTAALILIGNVISRATAITAASDDAFAVVPDAWRVLESAGLLCFMTAAMSASVVVGATSVVALRTGVLPRALAWAGVATAVALLATITFVPFFVLLLWVLATGATLALRRPARP